MVDILMIEHTGTIPTTRNDILRVYPQLRSRLNPDIKFAIRRLQAKKRAFPNVFLIGVQKCGTTSLQKYLSEHPSIIAPYRKEMKYFDLFNFKPMRWYLAHFPMEKQLAGGKITLDATPDYIFYANTASQIKSNMPDARFLVILRDPVDRAFSHYLYSKRRGYEDLSFMDALEKEDTRIAQERDIIRKNGRGIAWRYRENSYKGRGLYFKQLNHWFRVFSKDQFLIIDSDKLKNDRQKTFLEIVSFLKVTPYQLKDSKEYNKAPGVDVHMGKTEEFYLREFYREENKRLFELLGRKFNWK